MSRTPTQQEYVHERLGDQFATALSEYDTQRRVETLVDELLTDDMVRGRRALDVGCGLGFFSRALVQRGAQVTACDLGPNLVARASAFAGCPGVVADAMRLSEQFGAESFDLVISSECIEHTPEPATVVGEMVRVLRPGGYLVFSTPNRVWYPVVRLATLLRARPFDGHENFSTWSGLRTTLRRHGATILHERGLHLFPFQLPLHPLSRWCDRRLQGLRGVMINICILAQRSAA